MGADRDPPPGRDVSFRDDGDQQRYVAEVDGAIVGEAVYRREDDRFVFVHTEVDDRVEGEHVGSRLARFALDDVREKGSQVVASCPFIAGWIDRHPDYRPLLADGD